MEPNVPELMSIYKIIKVEPQHWLQGAWASRGEYVEKANESRVRNGEQLQEIDCGTAMCIAGHAVARAGCTFQWNAPCRDTDTTEYCVTPEGQEWLIEDYACEVLGLDAADSERLFEGGNTIEDIRDTIHYITGIDPESTL